MKKISTTLLLVLLGASSLFAQIPRTISYQGIVLDKKTGEPVQDGEHTLLLTLYPTRTGEISVYQKQTTVTTTGGLFSVLLDSISESVAFDRPYWLGIKVNDATELSPRTPLTSAPYSLNSPKNVINSIKNTDGTLQVLNPSGPEVTVNIKEVDWDIINDKPQGLPPLGAAGGDLTGSYPNPKLAATGVESGTYQNPTVTVTKDGRITDISDGPGVSLNLPYRGQANADTVFTINNVPTQNTIDRIALSARTNSTTQFWSNPRGAAIVGENTNATNSPVFGILGIVNSAFVNSAGVYGFNRNQTNGGGVQGYGYNGVIGIASQPTGGAGIMGVGSTSAFAGHFVGNVLITGNLQVQGQKNAVVVVDENDHRNVYCEEATEVWFSDYGTAQLINGNATVYLDPVFVKTISVTHNDPIKVFIQMNDETNGVYVKKFSDRFVVIENNGGTSNSRFDYRIIAKRKHFEDKRLEQVFLTK